jgi:hypothetical protein
MILRQKRISRRTLLRGAGCGLALPWLEAMTPRATGSSVAPGPTRMAVLYMPNGVNVSEWTPKGTGKDFELSNTLQPLAPFKDSINVFSNLWNEAARTGDGHYVKESSILSCTTITKTMGAELNMNGVSMDQFAAQELGDRTPLPSLELGIEPIATGVDTNVGYTRVYGCHIAWSSPTTPLAREINPRAVYQRLFQAGQGGGADSQQDVALLDRVLLDAKRMQSKVGSADKQRLEEYFSTLRQLEQRLQRATKPGAKRWAARVPLSPKAEPLGEPKNHTEHVQLMLDMTALAFQTDTTRITTFMFGNAVSGQNFRFLEGVSNSHHEISHHSNDADKLRQYQLINRWHIAQYAYLLEKLSKIQEGERSALDNSMVLFASALSDGNSHNPRNLPIVVAGKGGGRLATGQHIAAAPETPLANLYVSLLDAFGCPVDRFADSKGRLTQVLA